MHSTQAVMSVAYIFEVISTKFRFVFIVIYQCLCCRFCITNFAILTMDTFRAFARLFVRSLVRSFVRSIWESTRASVAMTLTQKITDTEYFLMNYSNRHDLHIFCVEPKLLFHHHLCKIVENDESIVCIHQRDQQIQQQQKRTNCIETKRDQKYM